MSNIQPVVKRSENEQQESTWFTLWYLKCFLKYLTKITNYKIRGRVTVGDTWQTNYFMSLDILVSKTKVNGLVLGSQLFSRLTKHKEIKEVVITKGARLVQPTTSWILTKAKRRKGLVRGSYLFLRLTNYKVVMRGVMTKGTFVQPTTSFNFISAGN